MWVAALDILANDWNILRVTPINGKVILKMSLKKSAIIEIKNTVVKGARYEFKTVNLCLVMWSSNKRLVIFTYLLVSSVSFFNNLFKNTLSKTLCTSLLDS